MRSEQELFNLILDTARADARVRAVILNGSRANPNAARDIFQDFDVVFIVTEIASFKANPAWIDCFGERMILQLPDDMLEPPPEEGHGYAYLIQLADGNRIDLSLYPLDRLDALPPDSLSVLLLDKDGILAPFPPASEAEYLPKPPSAKAFADCRNEFWWVSTYVAKGLWREEILYARFMLDNIVRDELMKMLTWRIGIRTNFQENPGKFGKHFKRYLEADEWAQLLAGFADADYDNTWDALEAMARLFRRTAKAVAAEFGFEYPVGDDERVTAHLRHVRALPPNAAEIH